MADMRGIAVKNIVVLIGSPRKGGNTDLLANAYADGARKAGHLVHTLSVIGKQIGGCIGCNACYRNEKHLCAQKDDMTQCYAMLAEADVIVIATPIYFYGVSSQLKAIIDRLHNPIRNTFRVKKLCLLAVCADETDMVFDSVKLMYASVLRYFALEDGGIVAVHGVQDKGDIKGNPALERARQMGACA